MKNESPEQRQARLARQVEDGKAYSNLYLNEDFQKFQSEQFDAPMAKMIEQVMNAELGNPDSLREVETTIVKYQTLRKAIIDSFASKIDTATKAREMLNNQRKPKEMQ